MNHTAIACLAAEPAIDWAAAYDLFLPRVYNFFLYRVGDREVAEDLTSTTWVEVWRCRQRYAPRKGALSTWIFTIAQRVAAQHYRRRRPLDLPLSAASNLAAEANVQAMVERRADIGRLADQLRRLGEREHALVALKYGAELTNRDIAQVLGLSESNVGTTLHRIVGRLRRELGGNDHDER